MATTTNYGWTTPDDTALVKDGASAIRALGTAIDTSMNTALGTKKSGLVLLNTTSFSAVASQSINTVFSATYDYYRIIVNFQPSASGFPRLRLRASGTDATSADYSWQQLLFSNTSVSAERNTGDTTWNLSGTSGANQSMYLQIEIYNPFATVNTWGFSHAYQSGAGQANHFRLNTSASYDGFTFYPSTGNMTGALSVFGFNK